jgi:hypothetical protein
MALDLALARHASEMARKEACERLEQEVAERTAELFHSRYNKGGFGKTSSSASAPWLSAFLL